MFYDVGLTSSFCSANSSSYTCFGFGTRNRTQVFDKIAPNGVVKSKGKRLVVCIIAEYHRNLSFKSPSSINVSTAGPTEKAVMTVIDPFGIHASPTNIASLTR